MSAQVDIAQQRDEYRKVYDTSLSKLLSAMWGCNLHMGLFASPEESLAEAQLRLKEHMARSAALRLGHRVYEAACGVGSTARYLARVHGASVHATNITDAQLEEARQATAAEGLDGLVSFAFADYHALEEPGDSYDCWWCQEALLYAIDKRKVLEEARRVVRSGGRIVFTDLLLTGTLQPDRRASFVADMKAPNRWSIEDWDGLLVDMGFDVIERRDWREHTVWTFEHVSRALASVRDEFVDRIGREAVEGTEYRVGMQLKRARAGELGWCLYALGV
jgi:cyclopropane fatty-acyl-phospholipid synthase-like methyltransferase